MPEMHARLRWPDGTVERLYSPSLVLAEHLDEGVAYELGDFAARCDEALTIASERVRAKYGFPCSRAAASQAAVRDRVGRYVDRPDATVLVEALETP